MKVVMVILNKDNTKVLMKRSNDNSDYSLPTLSYDSNVNPMGSASNFLTKVLKVDNNGYDLMFVEKLEITSAFLGCDTIHLYTAVIDEIDISQASGLEWVGLSNIGVICDSSPDRAYSLAYLRDAMIVLGYNDNYILDRTAVSSS